MLNVNLTAIRILVRESKITHLTWAYNTHVAISLAGLSIWQKIHIY